MQMAFRLFLSLVTVLAMPLTSWAQIQDDHNIITIESDMQSADDSTGIITATGNVRISYPAHGVVATSHQAQYFSREARVVLSGDVDVLKKGGNLLRAERVTYQLDKEKAVAEPAEGQQVFSQLTIRSKVPILMPLVP